MHINVTLDPAIINQCLALHFNYHPLGRRQLRKLLWIPLILVLISVYLLYTELSKDHFSQNFYLALLYIGFAFTYYFYMKKRMLNAGKAMAKSLGANGFFTMDVTEEKVTTVTPTTTITTNWSVFNGALISKNIVLLYQQNDTFSMYHESFFTGDDFGLFKTWVIQYVQPYIEV